MITVMCVIGTILINSVNSFYMDEFTAQMAALGYDEEAMTAYFFTKIKRKGEAAC